MTYLLAWQLSEPSCLQLGTSAHVHFSGCGTLGSYGHSRPIPYNLCTCI